MAVMQRTPCRWPTNGMRVSWLNWRALHGAFSDLHSSKHSETFRLS
jgi:hypothetical protein